jgi:hypothetical protein
MKLRSILLLAGLALAGVSQAQTAYTVTGTNLNTFDAGTAGGAFATVPITGLAAGDVVIGLDRRPANGSLVLVANGNGGGDGGSIGRLYTLDARSGQATLLSTLAADPADVTAPFAGFSGTAFGTDFNPVVDRLRVTSDAGQNLRINVNTGLVTTDGALNGATSSIQGSAYAANFPGTTGTILFGINGATDSLYVQSPPNDGTQVLQGALGVDTANTIGFDILTNSGVNPTLNTAYAALFVGGNTNLYTINTTTGAATLVGQLGGGEAIQGFAIAAGSPGGNGPSGVPAFGTGGLVLLGLLLGAFAVVVIRQSR